MVIKEQILMKKAPVFFFLFLFIRDLIMPPRDMQRERHMYTHAHTALL